MFVSLVSQDHYERYMVYLQQAYLGEQAQYGIGFFVYLLMYSLLYLSVVNRENFPALTLLFVMWIALRWSSNHLLYLDRVEIIVNALLICGMVERKARGWQRQPRTVALICIVFLGLYGTLTNLGPAGEPTRSAPMNKSDLVLYFSSPYLPYKFFWNE